MQKHDANLLKAAPYIYRYIEINRKIVYTVVKIMLMFREVIISYSFMNKKRCYAMSDFFSGKEMSFILILTFSVYIFVWNVPLQATNAMMIYFILLFLYTISKLLFSPQFRQFPLVKVLLAILFVLMLAEIIVAYSTHSIKITDLHHIFDYFSHMDLYS